MYNLLKHLLNKRMTKPALALISLSPILFPSSASFQLPSPLLTSRVTDTSLSLSNNQRNGNNNPFSSLMTGLTSSLFSSTPTSLSTRHPSLDKDLTSQISYSWDDIRQTLHSQQTPTERRFRSDLSLGHGPPSPLHKIRLYDSSLNSPSDVRVTLYRDAASWCPYCQKVWMTLEEKRIPYRVEKINMRCYGEKPASFTRMQPSGNIPVAVIDGVTYNQSNDIMYALERAFPEQKSLVPAGEEERGRAQSLLRLERQIFGAWMYWLTGPRDSGRTKGEFVEVLEEVERALRDANGGGKGKGFFLGDDVSIVDLMFAPFLERMAASLLFFKGFQMRVAKGEDSPYPYLNRWFDAMETLESYQLTKSDYYTHCWDLPPQLGGCSYDTQGEPYEKTINGEKLLQGTGGSWELPLQPHNGGVEPDWTWCGDDDTAKREATERLSHNHENIVKFAARGAGKQGFPPFSAPLADPNAIPAEAVTVAVDAVLRTIAMAMLKDTDAVSKDMANLASVVKAGGQEFQDATVKSLAYLRDRVGVPRDMRLPAARNLRAHINWSLKYIID